MTDLATEPVHGPRAAGALATVAILAAACVALLVDGLPEHVLVVLPLIAAGAAGEAAAGAFAPELRISAQDVVVITAGVYEGAPTALLVAVGAGALDFAIHHARRAAGRTSEPYSPIALLINIAALGTGGVVATLLAEGLGSSSVESWRFAAAVACGALAALVISTALLAALVGVRRGIRTGPQLHAMLGPDMWQTHALWLALVVIIAAAYREFGGAGLAIAIALSATFAYMGNLLVSARSAAAQAERAAEKNSQISWGVLRSLVQTLDARNPAAARHSAAVALFSRDIATELGLDEDAVDLAHLAGLLHDIGRFALPDRVLLPGSILQGEDWDLIHRHPVLGAELLQPLDRYGPVAQAVRHHHERIDGFGYPDGLAGDEIPLAARVVAVAEVYDTLTAEDTYRPEAASSFDALVEMRKAAGTQLDEAVVEALARVLAGQGTDYRVATAADFDAQLHIHQQRLDTVGSAS